MKIDDKYELIALHRCLIEAKFNPDPNDFNIAGSPIAAKIANMVVNELIVIDSYEWSEWSLAENHPDKIQNLESALKLRDFSGIKDNSERKEFIINALAPLVAGENLIQNLIAQVFDNK